MAAAAFASLPELVRCLAEQTRSRKQLARLSRTNKTFHLAVAPVLFREVVCLTDETLNALANCAHLGHVRLLEVRLRHGEGEPANKIVQQMLPRMPLLEGFCWNAALATTTLTVLHRSCPELKSIRFGMPCEFGSRYLGYSEDREYSNEPSAKELEAREIYGRPDLTVFRGLEELTLDNLCEELPWWRETIVEVLKNSPELKKLGLSLSVATIGKAARYGERDTFDGFFYDVCNDFCAAGAPPLHLQSLKCGTAIIPDDAESLQSLTDLTYLEEVHIENETVWNLMDVITMYEDGEESGIAFDALGPAQCPNLRRLTVSQYRGDVHELFAASDDPAWARQVALSFVEVNDALEPAQLLRPSDKYPSLPLHLRMLDVNLDREKVEVDDEEGGEVPTVAEVLHDLVAGDDGALEGLSVHFPLDMGHDSFSDLLQAVTDILPGLINLTQLSVVLPGQFDNFDGKVESTARKLAGAPSQVRYVKVQKRAWRVWRDGDGTVRLEELEDREISDVELFSQLL
ncbi:hypothetical protein QBC39DRAFT_47724 [Podospora conica]|nr:hypothetical protein QBC39DRAFT_47724 [Schizothecium conicum]